MTGFGPIDPHLSASEMVSRADSFAKTQNWQNADQYFRAAVQRDESPASRIAFGVYLASRERFNESICTFTSLLDEHDQSAHGIVFHNLAAIYRELGDLDLAKRFQWRATLSQHDLGSKDLLALANDALSADHVEVAKTLIVAAEEIMTSENHQETRYPHDPDLLATMGLIRDREHLAEKAIPLLFRAFQGHRALDNPRGMGFDLMNMSALFGKLNRWRAERKCLIRAMECFQRAELSVSLQTARNRLERLNQLQQIRSFDASRN